MSDIFMFLLVSVIVAAGTWYVTSEHYDERERKLKQQYRQLENRNRQLEDERQELDKQISQLEHSFDQYGDVLEGEPTGLEVVL